MALISNELITLRRPTAEDGAALHALIGECPPLDENSMYCNLLQCSHFSATSVVADMGGQLVASVSGYLIPGREDTLFVWQVAVSEAARGQGLGRKMLSEIVARPECGSVTHIETTVTASNAASWALFEGFSRREGIALERSEIFDKAVHFNNEHPSETLARMGPLAGKTSAASSRGPSGEKKEKTV